MDAIEIVFTCGLVFLLAFFIGMAVGVNCDLGPIRGRGAATWRRVK